MKLPDRFALEWFRNTLAFADVLIPIRVQDDDDVKDDDDDLDDEDEDDDEVDEENEEDEEDVLDEDDEADEDADDEELEEEASDHAPNRSPRELFWTPAAWSRC